MSERDKKTLDQELKKFTTRHFETPGKCRNLDQIRYYVQELCEKIQDYDRRFRYVPQVAYTLLAQYNAKQNTLLYEEFKNTYFEKK